MTGAELAELYGYGSNRGPARGSVAPRSDLGATAGCIIGQPNRWRFSADPRRVAALTGVLVVLGLEIMATMVSHHFTPFPWSVILAAVLGWSIRAVHTERRRRSSRGASVPIDAFGDGRRCNRSV